MQTDSLAMRKGGGWDLVLLGSFALFTWGDTGLAHGDPDVFLKRGFTHGLLERVSETPVSEPADAVLIQSKEWKWNRYLKNSFHFPDWLDFGLEHRTRLEMYDHPWQSSQTSGQTDAQIQQRFRVRFGLNGRNFKFLFEGQDSRVHLDDVDGHVKTNIKNEMDVLLLVVSVTVKNVLETGLRTDLHVGRFTMDFGQRRLIARNNFRNSTNAFDGMHWQLGQDTSWRLRLFLVEPVLRDDVRLDEQSKRNVFWGTYVETNQMTWLRFNAYYLGLNDQRNTVVGRQRTFSTFGIRLYEKPKTGQVDYEIESVWQTGKRGDTNHFAHFQHLDIGYSLDLPWSPRFLIHYDYASGDRNAQDSQDSTFDKLFGARRFEFISTGNFAPFFRTNVSSPGWRLIVVPYQGWKVQLKHRVWYLTTSRGAFASHGLHDSTGGSGNFLGQDIELWTQWKINSNLEFDSGYVHWLKGNYFDRLPVSVELPYGGNMDSDYFYVLAKVRV